MDQNYSINSEDLDISSIDYNNYQQGGGIMDIFNNTINAVKNVFTGENDQPNALNNSANFFKKVGEGAYSFILEKYNSIPSICDFKEPSTGRNILHYLAKDYNKFSDVITELTKKVLGCANVHAIINGQDNNRNTPLHIAVQNGNNKMVKLLISHGAEYGIQNNDGIAVVVTSSEEKLNESSSTSSSQLVDSRTSPMASPTINQVSSPTYKTTGGSEDTETFLNNLLQQYDDSNNNSYVVGKHGAEINTEKFLDNLVEKYNSNTMYGGLDNNSQYSDFDQFLDGIINPKSGFQSNVQNNMINDDGLDTEQFLNSIVNKYKTGNNDNNKNININNNSFMDDLFKEYDVTEQGISNTQNKSNNIFINSLLNKSNDPESAYTFAQSDMTEQSGNNLQGGADDSYDTDNFIDNIIKNLGEQNGGMTGGKFVSGKRKMQKYDNNNSNDVVDGELNRLIKSRDKGIHKSVTDKIASMMKVDTNTAKKYKSMLWKQTNSKYPNLTGLARSVQMQQSATASNLKKLVNGASDSSSFSASTNTSDKNNKYNKKDEISTNSSDNNMKGGRNNMTSNYAPDSEYDSPTSMSFNYNQL